MDKYIDKSLLDGNELKILDRVKDDDNPIIVRYVMKKGLT